MMVIVEENLCPPWTNVIAEVVFGGFSAGVTLTVISF